MHSLRDLNSYGLTTLTYTDVASPYLEFYPPNPSKLLTVEVNEARQHQSPVAYAITKISNPDKCNTFYYIDLTDAPAGTTVSWPSIPSGLSVINPSGRIYGIGPIKTTDQWVTVQNPIITTPNDYAGRYTYKAYILYDTNKRVDWSIFTIVRYWYLTENIASFDYTNVLSLDKFPNCPQIIHQTDATDFVYTITLKSSFSDSILLMGVYDDHGATVSYNSPTKTLTLTGTKTQLNEILTGNTLFITTSEYFYYNFYLSWKITNNKNLVSETVQQLMYTNDSGILSVTSEDTYVPGQVKEILDAPRITLPTTATDISYKIYSNGSSQVSSVYIPSIPILGLDQYIPVPSSLEKSGVISCNRNGTRCAILCKDETIYNQYSVGYNLIKIYEKVGSTWSFSQDISIYNIQDYYQIGIDSRVVFSDDASVLAVVGANSDTVGQSLVLVYRLVGGNYVYSDSMAITSTYIHAISMNSTGTKILCVGEITSGIPNTAFLYLYSSASNTWYPGDYLNFSTIAGTLDNTAWITNDGNTVVVKTTTQVQVNIGFPTETVDQYLFYTVTSGTFVANNAKTHTAYWREQSISLAEYYSFTKKCLSNSGNVMAVFGGMRHKIFGDELGPVDHRIPGTLSDYYQISCIFLKKWDGDSWTTEYVELNDPYEFYPTVDPNQDSEVIYVNDSGTKIILLVKKTSYWTSEGPRLLVLDKVNGEWVKTKMFKPEEGILGSRAYGCVDSSENVYVNWGSIIYNGSSNVGGFSFYGLAAVTQNPIANGVQLVGSVNRINAAISGLKITPELSMSSDLQLIFEYERNSIIAKRNKLLRKK